jgi:hypothetical protein
MNLYFEDEDITDEAKKARKIRVRLRSVGDEGLRKLLGSALSEDDKIVKKDPEKLFKFFEEQLPSDSVNFRIHRLQLTRFKIETGSREYTSNYSLCIDNFVSRVSTHALKCEFNEDELQERIVELVIASTPHEEYNINGINYFHSQR